MPLCILRKWHMLIFRGGNWVDVPMPDYVDPSWGFGDRLKAAGIIYEYMKMDLSFEMAYIIAECEIYMSLGVLGKEHGSPKNKEKDKSMKEESCG